MENSEKLCLMYEKFTGSNVPSYTQRFNRMGIPRLKFNYFAFSSIL